MDNFIPVIIVVLVVGLAGWYVYKAKKSGKKCVGCPDGCCDQSCSSKTCTCHQNTDTD